MILGEDLDPAVVSRLLKLRPNRSWQRGAPKTLTGPVHAWGGWKKFPPMSVQAKSLDAQLRYWVRTLNARTGALRKLGSLDHYCALDCYISTDATASIIVNPDLQRGISSLGLDLRISVFADNNQP
jgi:hypothetical protein